MRPAESWTNKRKFEAVFLQRSATRLKRLSFPTVAVCFWARGPGARGCLEVSDNYPLAVKKLD
jgi:hypothetical protein